MKKAFVIILSLSLLLLVMFCFNAISCKKSEKQEAPESTEQSATPEKIPAPGPEAVPQAPLIAPQSPAPPASK